MIMHVKMKFSKTKKSYLHGLVPLTHQVFYYYLNQMKVFLIKKIKKQFLFKIMQYKIYLETDPIKKTHFQHMNYRTSNVQLKMMFQSMHNLYQLEFYSNLQIEQQNQLCQENLLKIVKLLNLENYGYNKLYLIISIGYMDNI